MLGKEQEVMARKGRADTPGNLSLRNGYADIFYRNVPASPTTCAT